MSIRRVVVFATVVFVAGACEESPTEPEEFDRSVLSAALSGGVVEKVTGSGHFDDFRFPDAEFRTFSFTVREKADGGTSGQYELHNPNFDIRVHGEIECVAVAGNEAWFAGPTTLSSDENQIGVNRAFRVIDNGEGSGASADEVSFAVGVGSAQDWCDAMIPFGTNPIESGNVQVH